MDDGLIPWNVHQINKQVVTVKQTGERKMRNLTNKVVVGVAAISGILAPALARAEFSITPPTFDMTQMGTYAGTILTALAGIWLVRKFIKVTNRS